jgi:hypothetical protein
MVNGKIEETMEKSFIIIISFLIAEKSKQSIRSRANTFNVRVTVTY